MSWRPISSTYLKPAVVTSAVGGVLPSRMALVAVVVPWKTRRTSAGPRPASASTLRTAVMKPAERSSGVEGVLATQVAPVAASAKVMSVKVPPTSMASVQVLDMAPRNCRVPGGRREARRQRAQSAPALDRFLSARHHVRSGRGEACGPDNDQGGSVSQQVTLTVFSDYV